MEPRRKWNSTYSNIRLVDDSRLPDTLNLPRRHRPDYIILLLIAILLTIGLVVIYSISPGLSLANHVSQNYFINKQLLAVVLGIAAFLGAAYVPLTTWKRLQ